MRSVNMHEAKTHFSRLVDSVVRGEEIVIARAGKPAARLVPLQDSREAGTAGVRFGLMRGEVEIADNFDAPLPDDLLAAFEGRDETAA